LKTAAWHTMHRHARARSEHAVLTVHVGWTGSGEEQGAAPVKFFTTSVRMGNECSPTIRKTTDRLGRLTTHDRCSRAAQDHIHTDCTE
jgi:hypothetical protein